MKDTRGQSQPKWKCYACGGILPSTSLVTVLLLCLVLVALHWDFSFDSMPAEQVSQFKYLGSWITDDGYCAKDVRARIAMDKAVFMEKKKLLTGKLDCELKKRIIKRTVWNVALYAAEMGTDETK